MPSVSIIIPAYNAESTIAETLASVVGQTFEDFEVLVIDDGSRDDTAAVASASDDARVRVIRIPNGGVARARNHGSTEARAELIAFLDADDLWEPEKLEQQVAAIKSCPDAGLCVTAALRIDERGNVLEEIAVRNSKDVCGTLLRHAMSVGTVSSSLVRKSVLNAVGGFDPRFSQCADWDLWLRIGATTPFCVIDKPLVRYRSHGRNMSSDIGLLERDTFGVLDAFFSSDFAGPYQSLRSQVYGRYWMMCSGSYFQSGRHADAVRCALRGALTSPASLARVSGLPSRWVRRTAARRAGEA